MKPRQYEEQPRKTKNEQNEITACISLEGGVLSYVPLKFPNNQQRKALIDTGACANAITEKDYDDWKSSFGTTATISQPSEVNKVKLASGQLIPVRGQIQLEFAIAKNHFKEQFLVIPTTNSTIFGNPFFKNDSIELCPWENLIKLPDLTLQLNKKSTQTDKTGKRQYTIRTMEKCVIAPNQQTILKCNLQTKNKRFADVCGIVEPKLSFEEKTGLCITSSLSRTDSQGNLYQSALNLQTNDITIPRNSDVAYFKILSPQQAETLTPIDPQLLTLAKFKNPDEFEHEINQLIIDEEFKGYFQPPRTKPDYKKFWFPTPETCKTPTALKGVEKRIYNELQKLKELDKIDPHINDEYRNQFLQRFKWNESILKADKNQQVDD